MDRVKSICLLNDSFPPQIDGVANAVMNYASQLPNAGYRSVVLTPDFPEAEDDSFPFPIIRYPSIDLRKQTGYMAGIPFSPETAGLLKEKNVALLHTHCPIASCLLSRELRQVLDVPLVLTYHTKFDVDISNIMRSKLLQEGSKRALVENITACDEVWAVSQGAAENLRSLGYEGECVVMPNGVDLPRGRVSQEEIHAVTGMYDLPEKVPVFLFVGRLMWYKGLKIIVDALAMLKKANVPFRMVFIGSGGDEAEVKEYVSECGLDTECIFTGAIRDRQALRAWYCRASLFLFPSVFDTNGLVVREAAACSLGSMLIAGSCAAEGITDGQNGILIEESAESMYASLLQLTAKPEKMKQVGEHACEELYWSWADAVKHAAQRYEIVIDRYQSGACPQHHRPIDEVMKLNGDLMEDLANIQSHRHAIRQKIREHIQFSLKRQ